MAVNSRTSLKVPLNKAVVVDCKLFNNKESFGPKTESFLKTFKLISCYTCLVYDTSSDFGVNKSICISADVGKTSLILSLVSEEFPQHVS